MHQLLQFQRKDPPTPDQEQPIKRSRIRHGASSPDQDNNGMMEMEREDPEHWESPPNMPSSHSPDPTKSP